MCIRDRAWTIAATVVAIRASLGLTSDRAAASAILAAILQIVLQAFLFAI